VCREAAVGVGTGVSEVARDQRGGLMRTDDEHVPLAGEILVGAEPRAADADGGHLGHADAERGHERRALGEAGVARGGRRREAMGGLERAEHDDRIRVGQRAPLDGDRVRQQCALGRGLESRAGGVGDLGGVSAPTRGGGTTSPASRPWPWRRRGRSSV